MSSGEEAARLRSRGPRAALLALSVTFSAGIHAALVPEHLKEMPPLGWSFIVAAALGALLACALVISPDDRRLAKLAALFLTGEVLAWALFITVRVPGFAGTPEPVDAIALLCKANELLGLTLALGLGWPERAAVRSSPAPTLWRSVTPGSSDAGMPRSGR
jgi:hypothetical protein